MVERNIKLKWAFAIKVFIDKVWNIPDDLHHKLKLNRYFILIRNFSEVRISDPTEDGIQDYQVHYRTLNYWYFIFNELPLYIVFVIILNPYHFLNLFIYHNLIVIWNLDFISTSVSVKILGNFLTVWDLTLRIILFCYNFIQIARN